MTSRRETPLFTVQAPFATGARGTETCLVPRVVGIDAGDEILWTPQRDPGRSELNYERGDVKETSISVDGAFRDRLVGFFAYYLAQESDGQYATINCHLFGRWMIGASIDTFSGGINPPIEVITDGVITDSVDEGQRGVIGGFWDGKPEAAHSVIGLGQNRCIHIDGLWGPLRITSPEQALNKYISTSQRADSAHRGGIYIERAA